MKIKMVCLAIAIFGFAGSGAVTAATYNYSGVVTLCTGTCASFASLDVGATVTGPFEINTIPGGNFGDADFGAFSLSIFNPALPPSGPVGDPVNDNPLLLDSSLGIAASNGTVGTTDAANEINGGQMQLEFLVPPFSSNGAFVVFDLATGNGQVCLFFATAGCIPGATEAVKFEGAFTLASVPQDPDIDLEKATNGIDADDPNAGDAPQIMADDLVTWSYVVTNTGDVSLNNVVVTDDQGVAVTCPQSTLNPSESMTCSASGLAENLNNTLFTTVPGLCGGFPQTPMYENMGMATGESVTGDFVQDIDPSHYCNPQAPAIDIEKATNGVDADDPNAGDAPQIMAGDLVTWSYVVTNTGNVTLDNVTVTDDQGVAVSCPQSTLNPSESMTCTASGLAYDLNSTVFTTVPGLCGSFPNTPLYENMGRATGESPAGDFVQDTDPSHYCNPQAPAIDIEKATNGVDADDPNAGDAPQIMAGNLVSWTYLVTNTGNTPLFNVSVTDDQGVVVTCPRDMLEPGESMVCTASGLAEDLNSTGFTTVPGLCGAFAQTPMYENIGLATGMSNSGEFVRDTDPSHYCNPQATLSKEIISGSDSDGNGEFDLAVEVGQYVSTEYDFKISYRNFDDRLVLIEDTVPAEWIAQLRDNDGGRAKATQANKRGKGKGATKIKWEPDSAGGMITVWAETRQKRRNGKFSPTSCGALYLNNGAEAFEIDPLTLKPKVDQFGDRLPPILESNQLCLVAVSDLDGGGIAVDGSGDEDGDGMTDIAEACNVGSNPCIDDTDGDGVLDGVDACPLEAAVTDDDGDGCQDL